MRTCSLFLKWTSIALLIILISFSTLSSSADLVQHEETTLPENEMVHRLGSGPTSSILTTTMKALLRHMPARCAESVDHEALRSLTVEPESVQQLNQNHDPSDELRQKCYCRTVAHTWVKKEEESVTEESTSHFRSSDPSQMWKHYELNERAVEDAIWDEKSGQFESDSAANNHFEHDRQAKDDPSLLCPCPLSDLGYLISDTRLAKRRNRSKFRSPNSGIDSDMSSKKEHGSKDPVKRGNPPSFQMANPEIASHAEHPLKTIVNSPRDTTTQICSERWWLRRPNCRPRPTASKAESSREVNNNGKIELHISEHIAARDESCRKLWHVDTGCLPAYSARSKSVAVYAFPLLSRNDTVLESITEAKCHGKVGRERENCEEKNRTGFWILCSLLAVAGLCTLLIGGLVVHTHLKRKCSRPLLISDEPGHKSRVSTPGTDVSELRTSKVSRPATCVMRRIDEDENDSVHRYTTLDGADDGWTSWIQKQRCSRKGSHKGRFSPTPMTRPPRIPTLKLPQTTLATMRKAGGLGSEASQGKHTWKGKGKDPTRVKWCSTA